jgi:hypothetical protein
LVSTVPRYLHREIIASVFGAMACWEQLHGRPVTERAHFGGFSLGEETDLDNADDDQDCVDGARSFFAAYNAHDVNKMVAACSEDAEFRYVLLGNKGE